MTNFAHKIAFATGMYTKHSIIMFRLSFKHTPNDQLYISSWMQNATQQHLPNEGLHYNYEFFCKKNTPHGNDKIAIFRNKGKAEAFMLYHTTKYRIVCEVIYLNPAFHNQGIGRLFQTTINEYYQKRGLVISEIYQPSHKGLKLAKQLKYKHIDEPDKWHIIIHLAEWYKPLVEYRRQNWTANCRLILWANWQTEKPPIKSWAMNVEKCKKPILEPAAPDMFLGIMVGQKCVYNEKLKYFYKNDWVYDDGYLYITPDMLNEISQKYIRNKV